jgi:Spy/CpxP family protein refolding chaperone
MNHTFKSVFLILTLLLSTASLADKGEGRRGKFKKLIEELNLNDEQLQKIKEHRQSNKGKMKPLREEARTLREEMNKAFVNGASDGEFKSLNSRLGDLRSKMNEARLSKMLFFKNVLNKEQRQKWQEKKKGWKKRHKKRWKNKGSRD